MMYSIYPSAIKSTAVKRTFLCVVSVLILAGTVVASGQRIGITAEKANMRSGPGTQYDQLWQAERYYPLIVIEKKGKWYKVKDFEADIAWVHESLVGNISSVITNISKGSCNVRSKGSKDGRIIFTVERGVPFRVLERKKGSRWIKIKHGDGNVGWIHDSLVW